MNNRFDLYIKIKTINSYEYNKLMPRQSLVLMLWHWNQSRVHESLTPSTYSR